MAASDTQPGQAQCGAVFANGVLTLTAEVFTNPGVATSLDDANNTVVTTVAGAASGRVTITVEITPDSAIAAADNTVVGTVTNLNALSA